MRDEANGSPDLREKLARLNVNKRERGQEEVELVLPIKEFPKIPVLDLTITVAGKEVYRVPKDEGARIQARHIVRLAERAGFMVNDKPKHLIDFLTFLFYFPSHPYDEICRELEDHSPDEREYEYIRREFTDLRDHVYHQWKDAADEIKDLAVKYAIPDYASGAENPLLALPYLFQETRKRRPPVELSQRDVTELLLYLSHALVGAHRAASQDMDARKFVSTYFTYGYRWTAFARCTVPFDKSFIISVREKRAIYFAPERQPKCTPFSMSDLRQKGALRLWWRRKNRELPLSERCRQLWSKESWHMVTFADAETNHVSIRVSDTSVRLHNPQPVDERKDPLNVDCDEEEKTFELYLRQDSNWPRKERFYIKCPLRLTRLHSMMLYLTMIITALGIYLLLNRGLSAPGPADAPIPGSSYPQVAQGLTAKDATLILVPVSFAAAFLLIRDSSTLSAWIRRIRQSILLAELLILLAVAFMMLAVHHVKVG
ncbi:hypothetical protein G3M58_85935 [Streptomyces sp. SID7499]|uniref:Uncharacterized protein n=1 Tax=Streptomyces sp. SID7499 TaxID=2706086 RepID=A0A6G3XVA2_9ACTN|nr:hypothetical protein [Streptomyces sp. SID7499]